MSNFPWLKSYPDFVPQTVDVNKYTSILDAYQSTISKFGNRKAFVNMDVSITFNQLDEYSNRVAVFFQTKTNLKKGDRIAIQMPNVLQFPVVLFGAMKAGLVCVNTNPLYTPQEMKHQFSDSGAKAIVILENFASNLSQILKDTEIETVIVTKLGDMLGGLKGFVVNSVVKYVKKMVPDYHLPNAISFKSILNSHQNVQPQLAELNHNDIAFLQYTGGTTGVSKGAVLTHGNICANLAQVDAWITGVFLEGKETIVTALPLYHIFALTANCLVFFKYGATNVLITNPRDMKAFIRDLKKYPPSFITGVNTLFNGLLNQPDFTALDFSGLKLALGGGMAVQDVVALKWQKVTGKPLLEAYGLSETSPAATINPLGGSHRLGTIGLPIPNTDVKIFDDNGNELSVGERGEIGIAGPQVMPDYWKREHEHDQFFRKSFFMTGDIGVMDEDGFFKIVDRKKEMILVSGFNVFPSEVEAVIAGHPGVLEVGVKGIPDEKSNEAVKAFVVRKDPALTEQDIVDFCKDKLTNYKIPKHIVFREELPKSNVGKILRRMLE